MMFRSLRAFVRFTTALRYEPCTQFINVSQRMLHIYFIDGCRVCPLDAQYKVKKQKQRLVSKLPDCCFCFDFAWLVTLKLVWRKNSKNNEFRTKKFPNPEFLYGISSFCTLSENNSFLHGKISYFCIFLVKNRILNTEFSAMSHAIHKIVSKRRYQSYFQNFFFLPSLESFSLDPFSPASVAFFTAFRESPVSASNCFSSSLASGFNLSGVCTTSVT